MIRSPREGPHGDLARTPSDAGGGAGRTHRRAGRRDQAHQHDRRAVGQRAEAADRGRRAGRPRDHDRRRVRLRGEGPRARAELPGRAVSDVGIHPVSGALGAEISGVDLSNALAYQTLSDGMKRLLDGLRAVNSSAKADASRTREDRIAERGRDDARTLYEASHPVVRVHPETGRPALYVNVAHTVRFEGMTEEESAPILAYLYRHQVRPEFTCRFRWQPGSLAFWDNRCAQHNAVNDYAGHRRLMHRITLAGDVPAGAT